MRRGLWGWGLPPLATFLADCRAGLPRRYKTSELRSDHIGRLIALEGLVRTVTEVRPKVISAAFECQRCGHLFFKEQTTSKFQEPYDCPNEACDRWGPFGTEFLRA